MGNRNGLQSIGGHKETWKASSIGGTRKSYYIAHCFKSLNLVYKNVDIIILAMTYIQEKHNNLKYFESICVFYITLQYKVH